MGAVLAAGRPGAIMGRRLLWGPSTNYGAAAPIPFPRRSAILAPQRHANRGQPWPPQRTQGGKQSAAGPACDAPPKGPRGPTTASGAPGTASVDGRKRRDRRRLSGGKRPGGTAALPKERDPAARPDAPHPPKGESSR